MKQVTSLGKEHVHVVLSQHQKFHKAQEVAVQLATLTSEVGMEEYHDRLLLLKLLKDKLANGENVSLSSSNISMSMHLIVNYFCVDMLGCSTSEQKEKEVQTVDLTFLHGKEVQIQSIDDSVDTTPQDSKFLQRT